MTLLAGNHSKEGNLAISTTLTFQLN